MNKNFGLKFTYCVLGIALLIFVFVLGFSIGVMSAFSDIRTYAGVTAEKEYLPKEIKEDLVTKTIEKYDEQYLVKVKDHAGDIVVMNVAKEEFNQINIGEKLKR